jgi:zinc transport system substrate-binding protein
LEINSRLADRCTYALLTMVVISEESSGMRRMLIAGLTAVLAVAMSGCTSSSPSAADDPVGIVAAFYPLQFIAERVGGDTVQVTNLAPPGAEPHDLELSPAQVASIAEADLVLYLDGFQPAVDEAVAQGSKASLDVATLVTQLDPPQPIGPPDPDREQEESDKDPHVWLDPMRLATIVTELGDKLAEFDPDNASSYRTRATELGTELGQLDREFADGLTNCQRHEIVVSHAAFGYLADRYGLRQIPITGLSPEVEPTPQHLAAAAEEAKRVGATTVFFETLVSPAVAEVVATTIGAETAVLDPIEGLEPGVPGDYLSVMRENLATLRPALGCT